MNIALSWLKDYVEIGGMSAEELADLLTFSGLEVEGVEKRESIKGGLEHVVIGEVLTCEEHPNSDHLHVTTVDVGTGTPLHIVCGAPNVAKGQKVVCATIGTKIYTSENEYFEIKKGKLRGEVSEGMLCAEDELGLGQSHDGIMVLPQDAKVGMAAKEYFNLQDDYVLEVAITANRSDATSHIGVARDVVAVLNTREGRNLKLQYPEVNEDIHSQSNEAAIKVSVEDKDLCPRYSGVTIRNVSVKESPEWLQNRLKIVGLRPINNIVDITNYVLMEVGQPLHAFDADMIEGGEVVVRRAKEGAKFVTLDGVDHTMSEKDLMICNKEEGMCIAGVFGGEKSGVTMQTKNLFIESAYFNPVSIRKTSKRHGIKTDASFRYERGCDPNITIWALKRAVSLIQELAGGEVCGEIVDLYPEPIAPARVVLDYQRMFDLIGKEIPREAVRTALVSLNMEVESDNDEAITVLVPTCKVDVTRECDVVEEVMRIYGYNNITFDDRLNSCLSYSKKPNPLRLKNMVSDYLSDNGFSEIMNNSLTKSEYYEDNADFPQSQCVSILNPLSKELNVMRQTLLYSGLECIARNLNFRISDQKVYEFGRTYKINSEAQQGDAVTKRYVETQHVSLFTTGNIMAENWHNKPQEADFYYLKCHLHNILSRMRVNMSRVEIVAAEEKYLSKGLAYRLKDNKKVLAVIGIVAGEVLKKMDIKQSVYYADLDWDMLLKGYPTKEVQYEEVAKYPQVRRDLALILDKKVTFAEVEKVVRQAEKKLLKEVGLFDVYEGKGIAEGMHSYAVSFILQDKEKTLNDSQIESAMQRIQKALEESLGAKIRG